MAQNKKFYSLVGDNGYGLFTSWDDLQEKALKLEGNLHFYKFSTAKEAYNDILKSSVFRWRIRRVGVIDLPSLLKKQFVLLESCEDGADIDIEEQDIPATVGSIYQKASNKGGRVCGRKYGTLAELLAEEDDQGDKIQTEVEDDELYQLFKSFYKKYKNEAVEGDDTANKE